MKKTIIAVLLAVLMVFFCACSGTSGSEAVRIPVPETPAGWSVYNDGPVYLYYPEGLEESPDPSLDFQVANGDTGDCINIGTQSNVFGSVEDITDDEIDAMIETVVTQFDAEYEAALGMDCNTYAENVRHEYRTFGNEKCLTFSYNIVVYVPDYDVSVTTSFYQISYADSSSRTLYTATYCCFPEDDSVNAESYYGEALDLFFIA